MRLGRVAHYPESFEAKIAFDEVRMLVAEHALTPMGRERVEGLVCRDDFSTLSQELTQVQEMQQLLRGELELPSLRVVDCREALQRIRPQGTYIEQEELADLLQMLRSLHALYHFFRVQTASGSVEDESLTFLYPELSRVLENCPTFPKIEQAMARLLGKDGKIRDNATGELLRIRTELSETERSISGSLQRILRTARAEGWVEEGVQPSLRDGRLVIPVSPMYKRKIKGIVHDESATGRTVYIEPVELVEANNRIRELEAEERRELIHILTEIANKLRPNLSHLLGAYELLGVIDFIRSKAQWGLSHEAICPRLEAEPRLEWFGAKHPLLMRSLKAQGREIVPLDIELSLPERRLLIISGPNAGGKSVCLKTVGLLQYMVQCALPIPVAEQSRVGVFSRLFIDIGDEQSIEDDLSTYSSHLSNMKHFARECDPETLILIDEFGGGTEPTIGGAIAQALLHRFNEQGAWGVITTHYQNLKTFAEDHEGLVNGAMLYDRHEMRPLFRLSIGRPGSSFAIEIARKIGLPEEVIQEARQIVGSDYIDMDKYLQDIIRDKRYWEGKRESIRREEKALQQAAQKYHDEIAALKAQRAELLAEARDEAKRIVNEAGSRVERTIREIKEAEAERERTISLRQELRSYQEDLSTETEDDGLSAQKAQREVERILRRRERKAGRGQGSKDEAKVVAKLRQFTQQAAQGPEASAEQRPQWTVGQEVRIEGQQSVGTILSIKDEEAIVAMGMLKVTIALDRLRQPNGKDKSQTKQQQKVQSLTLGQRHSSILDQLREKRLHFKQDLDLRGMRVNEALEATTYFVDDALQLGISRVRILHGTGTGALREAIRQYLSGVPGVRRYADEHVQLGGAGITVIDLE